MLNEKKCVCYLAQYKNNLVNNKMLYHDSQFLLIVFERRQYNYLYSNPMETIIKYFVTNLNKHTTQHQGRASRLLMLRVHTASDTATDLYLRNLS